MFQSFQTLKLKFTAEARRARRKEFLIKNTPRSAYTAVVRKNRHSPFDMLRACPEFIKGTNG
jgi:hypothetical protein